MKKRKCIFPLDLVLFMRWKWYDWTLKKTPLVVGFWSLPREVRHIIYEDIIAEVLPFRSFRSMTELREIPTSSEMDIFNLLNTSRFFRSDLLTYLGWRYRWTGFIHIRGVNENLNHLLWPEHPDRDFADGWTFYGTSRRQAESCFSFHFRDSRRTLHLMDQMETCTLAVNVSRALDAEFEAWCERLADLLRHVRRMQNLTLVFKSYDMCINPKLLESFCEPLKYVKGMDSICLKTPTEFLVLWEPSGQHNREVVNLI